MTKMIFLNLPVRDLAAATRFYEAIGCEKNAQFSDENAASMVWSDTITFMLLTRDYFSTFTTKPIADAKTTVGALIALSRDSREDVDGIVTAAAGAGGRSGFRDPMDLGWMYNCAFEDPDGNVFEAIWMDMEAATKAMAG